MKKYSWKSKVYTTLSCIFFIGLWQISAMYINNEIYIPKIQSVFRSLVDIISGENFINNIYNSFLRTVLSYTIALVLGVILGVLSMMYPLFEILLKPLNSLIRTIPTLVLVVLSLIWFNKDLTPFVVGFAVIFPVLYEGIKNCIKDIDYRIIEMTEIYEVSFKDVVKSIYIPNIKFYLLNIFISTFSLTFKVVIAGEVHGQPKYGIGTMVQVEKVNFNTPGIFAWIVIIMIISVILEVISKYFNKKTCRWVK